MSFYVHFDVNQAQFNWFITELNRRMESHNIALFLRTVVDPFIRNRIDQRFAGEGDDVSGRWHPLTVATQNWRATQGFPPDHPINQRTMEMRHFLTGTPGDIRIAGPLVTLTNPPPPPSHWLGVKIQTAQSGKGRPRTPPRPVLGFNTNDMLFVTSHLAAYLIA